MVIGNGSGRGNGHSGGGWNGGDEAVESGGKSEGEYVLSRTRVNGKSECRL